MNLSPGKIININKFELIVPQVELEIMARGSNNCIVRVSNSLKAMMIKEVCITNYIVTGLFS
jgi:hypothetical protein